MKPFSILLLNASPVYAGGEFYVLLLAGELRRMGHAVHVACRSEMLNGKCASAGIPVVPFPMKGNRGLVASVVGIRRAIRSTRAGIVHSNTVYERTAAAIAARMERVPHVANIHSFESISHNLTHWIRNKYLTARFVTAGECVRQLLIVKDRIPADNITTVHLGLDPATAAPRPGGRKKVRDEFGVGSGELLIGNVGRLVPFKGQRFLIDAFAAASTAGASGSASGRPQMKLLIAGDGELGHALRDQAVRLGVGGRVILAGFRDDMEDVYSAFDIYAHSSVEGGGETFPFAVLQALAYGLPIAATAVGDVGVMVRDGQTGLLVPDGDPRLLSTALAALADDPVLRADLAGRANEMFRSGFTVSAMAAGVERIYKEITS